MTQVPIVTGCDGALPWRKVVIARSLNEGVVTVSGSVSGRARNCTGCGKPLSRYNTVNLCQACISAGQKSTLGPPGNDPAPLVDRAKLAQLRHDRGWTQEMLADYAGLSCELVKKLEQGIRRSARISTLSALAGALNAPVGALLSDNVLSELTGGLGRQAEVTGHAQQAAEPSRPTLLRALITQRHWQRFRTFEAQFRRAARELAERERDPDLAKLTVSSRQWERWYAGSVKTEPHPDASRVLEHMFGRPIQQLLAPAQDEQIAHDGPVTDLGDIQELMTWVTRTNMSDDAIEQIAREAAYLAEVHSQIPPQMILTGVLQTHQKLRGFLRSGKQQLRQTRELLRIDSELLAHACLLFGDLGQDLKAAEYGVAALVLAQEAGADEAIARSVQAKTARWQKKYVESAELARRGFEVSAPSPTKVELAYREANAIALFGDARRARLALGRAQEVAEGLPTTHGSPRSVWSFPIGRQAIFALSVAIHTGDPDSALRAAAMAETGWASGEPRIPANWAQIQAGSSIAYLMKGSLDGAASHIAPVLGLPRELRISTVIGYLRKLESMLAEPRFAKSEPAARLTLQIKDFITTSPLDVDAAEE
jgi:transcriptional regulator with XRE-family HTH domain